MTCPGCGSPHCSPTCGRHALGCFFGGPPGQSFWFAHPDCDLPHDKADRPTMVGDAAGAWEHLTEAGLRVTSEQGGGHPS